MSITGQDWEIKSRAHACEVTGRPFAEGESFYTLLFREKGGFRRQDMCEEAWNSRNDNIQPFSFWRTKYEPPPPPEPEPLAKETAEDLFRGYMAETDASHTNARYILALMLERKRILRQTDMRVEDGEKLLIYEHPKTGEVFIVPDPQLRLDQIEAVQTEVAALLR